MLAHANNAPQPPPRACGIPGRRPLPPPPHVALPTLDLHAWADGWSLSSTTRAPAGAPVQHDDLVSPTSLAPAPPPPSASSQSFNAGSRAGSVAPPLGTAARSALPSSSSSSFPQCDKPLVPTGALEGFDLDGGRPRCAAGGRDEVYHRLRQNSLELSLGDLPQPASFLRAAVDDQPYPSPVSPASRLFADQAPSCYFDPSHMRRASTHSSTPAAIPRDDLALPPSPALVPVALHPGGLDPRAFSPAPRAEPSTTHPLHHAKRLSMTPLSSSKALPHVAECAPPAVSASPAHGDEPPKLRKSSIVDLPLPQAAGGNGLPFSPPLTPPAVVAALGPGRTLKRQRQL